ncbi:MAG: Zonular occludens toxin, partial [Flavobacteriales bacterium]|nr:Zonular occludens toxin [Flavobacteriales bacterium]
MEGLPRSGKSYETASQYILKSLKEGRPIDAYIEGLNFEQFAELAELPIEKVKELLVQITREQVPEIYKHTRKNALVVIDELQNFFQAGRQPMSDEMTKFLTEHGHEGQDIIGMGQDLNDVHKLWRNRCQRKFVFEKQDAIGRDGHYKWTAYRAIRAKNGLKFEKINSGTRKYEEKYFGLYASHSEGVSNFDTFKDDRTNIFKTAGVTFYLPLFLCVFAYAGYHIYGVFSGGGITNAPSVSIEQQIDQDIARQQQKIAPPTEIAVAA